jgi:hypothetical protein
MGDIIQPTQPTEAPKTKNKLELLAEFKKNIEKNGYKIADNVLEGLLQSITIGMDDSNQPLKKSFWKLNASLEKNQWLKIFPKGKYFFEKYNDYFVFDDNFFNQVILSFQSEKLFKPYMDINHKLEEKIADITELKIEKDGLYGRIELNETGHDLIKGNKYSYISPEWGDRVDTDKVLHKNVLWAVTLTNIPAFEGVLQTVQEQIKLTKGLKMEDLKSRSIKLEGKLSGYNLASDPTSIPTIDPNVLMEAVAMLKEAIMKIDELTGQTQEQAEEIAAQKISITSMNKEKEEKEIEDFFSESVKTGKIDVSEVEDMKELFRLNKDKVKSIIAGRKEKVNIQMTNSFSNAGYKLTSEDYFIMEQQGYDRNDPKDVAAYLKAIKE